MRFNSRQSPSILGLAAAIAFGVLSGIGPIQAEELELGAEVRIHGHNKEVNAAGAEVTISGEVDSDIRVAGAEVVIDAEAGGDIWAIGAEVSILGASGGDLFAAGAEVIIGSAVSGDLKSFGAEIVLTEDVVVAGSTEVYGEDVIVNGTFSGKTILGGESLIADGVFHGDLILEGNEIVVQPDLQVDGDLTIYSTKEPIIPSSVQISGDYRYKYSDDVRVMVPGLEEWAPVAALTVVSAIASLIVTMFVFVIGIVVILVSPDLPQRASRAIKDQSVMSFVVGLAALVVAPIVTGLLFATIIGIPVAIIMCMLILIVILLGYLCAAYAISALAFEKTGEPVSFGKRLGYIIVGLTALFVAGLIPLIGELILVLALLFGIGGFLQALFVRRV